MTKNNIKILEQIVELNGKCLGLDMCKKCPFRKCCWSSIVNSHLIPKPIRVKAAQELLGAKLLGEKITIEEALMAGGLDVPYELF